MPGWFDVDQYRLLTARRIVARSVDRHLLVLGSTQALGVVDEARARRAGVTVVRRRSGGGAVYLSPGDQVWVDVWVPRRDPLWTDDPRRAAAAVGQWWARALERAGAGALRVHAGPSVPAPGSEVVCFAGIGPGEVVAGARKAVGLAQWRSREGALVHGCAYRRWDPERLVDVLAVGERDRGALTAALEGVALGLEDLGAASFDFGTLVASLPGDRPWDVVPP